MRYTFTNTIPTTFTNTHLLLHPTITTTINIHLTNLIFHIHTFLVKQWSGLPTMLES